MSAFIGVVFNRAMGGEVVRIINPDFDWQLDIQVLTKDEYLLHVPKEVFSVNGAMDFAQVQRVIDTLGPRK